MKYTLILSFLLSCSHIEPLSRKSGYSEVAKRTRAPQSKQPSFKKEIIPSKGSYDPTITVDDNHDEDIQLSEPQIVYQKPVQEAPPKISRAQEKIEEYAILSQKEIQEASNSQETEPEQEQEVVIESSPEVNEINIDPAQVAAEISPDEKSNAKEFDFHSTYEKKSKWLNYFAKQKNKERLERFFNNGSKYREYVESVFEENELPKDLFFVGMIESGYQLKAKSTASAVGPWQFIKSSGKQYGLKVNSVIDERRDIFKSTKAAALYFKDLYNIFGSWELALSAYNAGPYRIINLITRENTRDFAVLSKSKYFPKETADYVPKVQAVMEIYQNMEGFGIQMDESESPFENTKLIPLKYSLSLDTIAKKLGVMKAKLKAINPELKTNDTPFFRNSSYQLRIPNSAYNENIVASLKTLKDRNPYKAAVSIGSVAKHRVRKGENLYFIAAKYKTTIKKIMKLNKFKNSRIYIGQNLRVPKTRRKTYTVRKGDNLSIISKKFGKKMSELSKLNNIKSSKIFPGQKLIIK